MFTDFFYYYVSNKSEELREFKNSSRIASWIILNFQRTLSNDNTALIKQRALQIICVFPPFLNIATKTNLLQNAEERVQKVLFGTMVVKTSALLLLRAA